jgi:hypothetical protein
MHLHAGNRMKSAQKMGQRSITERRLCAHRTRFSSVSAVPICALSPPDRDFADAAAVAAE